MPKMNAKFQTIKLETCKPNHTNLKACPWQLLHTDTNCTKLWGEIKHHCALRQPSTVTPFDNEKLHIEANPLTSHAKVGRITEAWNASHSLHSTSE